MMLSLILIFIFSSLKTGNSRRFKAVCRGSYPDTSDIKELYDIPAGFVNTQI